MEYGFGVLVRESFSAQFKGLAVRAARGQCGWSGRHPMNTVAFYATGHRNWLLCLNHRRRDGQGRSRQLFQSHVPD